MQRRRLLLAPAALVPVRAQAFRAEPLAGAAAEDYAGGCASAAWHAALRREVERLLDGRPLPEPVRRELDRLATCPLCGCRVVAPLPAPPAG